jgi:hypothetical protein
LLPNGKIADNKTNYYNTGKANFEILNPYQIKSIKVYIFAVDSDIGKEEL